VSYEVEERAKEMKKLYQQIRAKSEKTNEMYEERANKHRKALTFMEEKQAYSKRGWSFQCP